MIGDLISAGSRLVGGFLDSATADRNRESQEAMADRNIAKQEQFAREGIRWKVHDAREAGIHPLYALGANTTSFSPVSISGGSSSNWSDTLGSMGQDVSRAINATRTSSERDEAFQKSAQALDLEGKKLDNDIKRASLASSVARIRDNGNPPMPGPGKTPDLPGEDQWDERKLLTLGRGRIKTDPYWANTESATDRWGESADWWYGPQVMWADYKANYGAPSWMPTFRPGSWLHRTFGDSFSSRFGDWKKRRK